MLNEPLQCDGLAIQYLQPSLDTDLTFKMAEELVLSSPPTSSFYKSWLVEDNEFNCDVRVVVVKTFNIYKYCVQ